MRNFEEAWEWTQNTLIEGLFESDVDDTGNIMMYNQLVGGSRLASPLYLPRISPASRLYLGRSAAPT